MNRVLTVLTAIVAIVAAPSVASAATSTPEGSLAELPGTSGCLAETGLGGKCGVGVGLDVLLDVVVSPDGNNVYTFGRETIGAYARHADGSLTQINCVSESGTFGKCEDGYGLIASQTNFFVDGQLILSRDGKNLYAFNDNADMIVVFSRQSDGSIKQLTGAGKCVSDDTFGGECTAVPLLNGTWDLDLSADGRHMYVASKVGNVVVVLQRDPATGVLTQSTVAEHACISPIAPGCKPVSNVKIQEPIALDISGDGKLVYIVSDGQDPTARDVVASFTRNETSGELTPVGGTTGCVSASGSGGQCLASPLGNQMSDVVVAPNGRNIYLTSTGRIEVDPQTGAFGKIVESLEGPVHGNGVWSGASSSFTSDGRFVYSEGRPFQVTDAGDLIAFPADDPFDVEAMPPPRAGTSALSPDDQNVYVTSRSENYGESVLYVYNRVPPALGFGQLKRKRNGSALLPVNAPDAGTLTLAKTKLLKGQTAQAPAAGPQTVWLKLVPSKRAKKKLSRSGRVTVKLSLVFDLPSGQSTSSSEQVKLRRAGRRG